TIATLVVSPKKRRLTSNRLGLQIPHSLDRKQNFSFSTMCDLRIAATRLHTSSIAPKDIGTARAKNFQTSGTKFGRRKVTFQSRRWIRCKTFATKCVWSWRKQASRSSASTTKLQRQVRRRSTFVSRR